MKVAGVVTTQDSAKDEQVPEGTIIKVTLKQNLTDEQVLKTLYLISTRLMNLGYKVYKTDEKYTYNEKEYVVQSNQLLVGIKE